MNKERRSSLCGIQGEEPTFSYAKVSKNENLNSEAERLRSFTLWSDKYAVDPARLAKSGFYYTGKDDEVVCFSCNGHIKNWQYGDIVQRKHLELFPKCNFVNNRSNNIPFVSPKVNQLSSNVLQNGLPPVQNKCLNIVPANDHFSEEMVEKVVPIGNEQHCQNSNLVTNLEGLKEFTIQRPKINSELICKGMRSEEKRLESFKSEWPLTFVSPAELAHAGFFYLGIGDKVQCPYCKGIVSDWEVGDKPLEEHARHFPRCPFVIAATNITHCDLGKNTSWYENKGFDVCGKDENLFQSHSLSKHKLLDKGQEHTKLEELGVSLHRGPVHPQQATLGARLRSFSTWSPLIPVRKEDLANAGFFYIGISDHTKCFYCDGGLCSWEPVDDPWVEHARWFRNCNFVRLNKGDDFIKSCVEKYATVNDSEEGALIESAVSFSDNDGIILKVEAAMKSSIITAVLETGIFPVDLVQTAVTRQIREKGTSFSNLDQVCEAVQYLQQDMAIKAQKEDSNYVPSPEDLSIQIQTSPSEESSMGNAAIKQVLPSEEMTENAVNSNNNSNAIQCKLNKSSDMDCENSLSNHRLCKICMDKEAEVVFLPCRHMLACTSCTPALKDCPLCRVTIQATVTAYIP